MTPGLGLDSGMTPAGLNHGGMTPGNVVLLILFRCTRFNEADGRVKVMLVKGFSFSP